MPGQSAETKSSEICQKRLFMADYSSLARLPLVPGRVFYAPQVFIIDKYAPQEQLVVYLTSDTKKKNRIV